MEVARLDIARVVLGERTALANGELSVAGDALAQVLRQADARIRAVRVHVAVPSSSTRIVCVKDVIEPRVKVEGGTHSEGRVLALSGMAVVTCGPIVGFQEGIIDMSGQGAMYTPFSSLHLVVLEIEVDDALEAHAHEEVLREAGLRAALHLAEVARDAAPDRVERFDSKEPVADDLPRVGYVYLLQSQGLLHDTYVLGENAQQGLPRIVSPEFVLDDAITSGNCVSACDKNTTYHHQNNPVVRALMDRHGRDLNFVGVVLSNEAVRLGQKRAAADGVLELARELRLDGVVISKEGFGNPDADLMMIIRRLEQAGVRTVGITDEYAGSDGVSQSLADATPEADAIVSTGNANEVLILMPMDQTIGPEGSRRDLAGHVEGRVAAPKRDLPWEFMVELQMITGATNEMGFNRMTAREV